jgi:hypothetical protein
VQFLCSGAITNLHHKQKYLVKSRWDAVASSQPLSKKEGGVMEEREMQGLRGGGKRNGK